MNEMNWARSIYRAVLPASLRTSRAVTLLKTRYAPHDAIYSREYYESDVEDAALRSAPVIARTLSDLFQPGSVADVGCGTGAMLAAFRDLGKLVQGFEYATAGIEMCREKGLEVQKFDIERDAVPAMRLDLVISMEVAEHLPERIADRYVDILTGLAPNVALTAATPGQGGTDHVNLQPHSYWIDKLERRGRVHDAAATERLRADWEASGVESWYHRNIMVFRSA